MASQPHVFCHNSFSNRICLGCCCSSLTFGLLEKHNRDCPWIGWDLSAVLGADLKFSKSGSFTRSNLPIMYNVPSPGMPGEHSFPSNFSMSSCTQTARWDSLIQQNIWAVLLQVVSLGIREKWEASLFKKEFNQNLLGALEGWYWTKSWGLFLQLLNWYSRSYSAKDLSELNSPNAPFWSYQRHNYLLLDLDELVTRNRITAMAHRVIILQTPKRNPIRA